MIDLREPLTFNEQQLFELVHRRICATRADISETTGLTTTTVSRLVSRLVDVGLLSEKAERSGGLGQPRRLLSVRPRQAFSVGVNFMRGRFDLAIVDLAGEIAVLDSAEIEELTPEAIVSVAAERLEAALASSGIARRRLLGAGFSLPGGFSPDGETLLAHVLFQPLDQKALAPIFGEALGLTCSVETDGGCAALGEYLFGHGAGHDTFFLVHIGHGVGGGAVLDGQLFRGAHGNASKPGVLFPYGKPRPSGQDLVEMLSAAGHHVGDIADIAGVSDAASATVEGWVKRAAGELAVLGRVITAFLDPEVIFIGGRLPDALNRALVAELAKIELPGPSRGLTNAPFASAKLGPSSGVLGAASLPVFDFFFPGSRRGGGNAYVNGRRATSAG